MQDLNEIFNRRRERAMCKIQLNKQNYQTGVKKKQFSIQLQQKKLKEETVDWTKSKIIGMQCMQELFFRLGELRRDTV